MGTRTIVQSLTKLLCLAVGASLIAGCKSGSGGRTSSTESWESISNRWSAVSFNKVERKAERGDATAQFYVGIAYELGLGVQSNQVEALKWVELAAKQGMPRAERRVGLMLQHGMGTPTNLVEAAKWYRLGAEHGDAASQNNLGWFYQQGLGVQRDRKEALKWYQKAAEQGQSLAQKNLARLYAQGVGFPPDHELAEQWMRKAVDLNDAEGQFEFACLMINMFNRDGIQVTNRFPAACEYFKKAAEQGHAKAQFQLAFMYHYGMLGDDQRTNCIPWFLKAAAQGINEAQTILAELPKSYRHSDLLKTINPIELLLKSAENGNLNAQFELARRYQVGDGVEKMPAEAFKWMQLAAQNKTRSSLISRARYRLGVMYENGYGVASDPVKARELYRNAVFAEFTDASAAYRVAQMFETGQDLPRDDDAAVEWYFTAFTAAGSEFVSEAIESLLRLYADGRGFRKDRQEPLDVNKSSTRLYNVPALLDFLEGMITSPRAQFCAGQIFYQGNVVQRDDVEAGAWLRLAAKQGKGEAKTLLETVNSRMSDEQKKASEKRFGELEQQNCKTR